MKGVCYLVLSECSHVWNLIGILLVCLLCIFLYMSELIS